MATQTGKEKKKTGGKVGKPPINDPDDIKAIQSKIDLYFKSRTAKDDEGNEYLYRAPTFSGLTLALGVFFQNIVMGMGYFYRKNIRTDKKSLFAYRRV